MFAGLSLSIATLVISVAIWYFSDDDLQDWLEQCVFGIQSNQNMGTGKPEAQMENFSKALIDVT